MLVGVDEVGRGCLAGPLCVAAVALGQHTIDGLTDSKLLTKKRREVLAAQIKQQADSIGIGWVSAADIDQIGLGKALKVAATNAVMQIAVDFDQIIVDGIVKLVDDPRVTTMKKADLLMPSVSAASIVAKVARDHYMHHTSRLFPGYGFATHVGYGTAAHLKALQTHGPSPIHRMSFAPFTMTKPMDEKTIKTTSGRHAEQRAAAHLVAEGYEVITTNWKTKWCEIDIVAVKDKVVHFVEVKYRKQLTQGAGLDYIVPKKQRQMRFAATYWLTKHAWRGESRLSACEVSGSDFTVTGWLPNIG